MPYQGVGLSTPLAILALLEFFFSFLVLLFVFTYLLLHLFLLHTMLCSMFSRASCCLLRTRHPTHLGTSSVLSGAWDTMDAQQMLLLFLLLLSPVRGLLWFPRPECGCQ